MSDAAAHQPPRRWWFFALKDRLPLGPGGWTVVVHQPECSDEDGRVVCFQGAPCHAHIVRFLGIPTIDESLSAGVADMTRALDIANGRPQREEFADLPEGFPDHRWVIVVSVVEPDDHPIAFDDVFELVVGAVTALRNATGVAIPDPSIERVQPMYMMALQRNGGEIVPSNIIIVDHAAPGPPRPATDDQLVEAQYLLVGRFRRHPVEQYRTFSTKARTAAWQEGNYEAAILNAAIACEILIKSTAWMITYEASLMNTDPARTTTTARLNELRLRQLIGQVLQPRLGGDWDSKAGGKPVSEWRVRVAQRRNSLLHLGNRASSGDADAAVRAMNQFATHVMDHLARRGAVYPRTAYALVGTKGLEKRACLTVVQSALAEAAGTPEDWITGYVAFVDNLLGNSE